MIRELNCDIFDSNADIICHQCNCFCTMGTGIALEIKKRFYMAYQEDLKTKQGDYNKLGTISKIKTNDLFVKPWGIINYYGQFRYGRDKRYTDYEAVFTCFEEIRGVVKSNHDKLVFKNSKGWIDSIAFPYKCGCNNAGGDWRIVRPMFDVAFGNCDFDVLICKK